MTHHATTKRLEAMLHAEGEKREDDAMVRAIRDLPLLLPVLRSCVKRLENLEERVGDLINRWDAVYARRK